jgi:2-C-methyl-D-erythritol 4-phosphate cytidylyltransferase
VGAIWAVVVAAGAGRRYGGLKQFSMLGGRPVLEWSVEAARTVADEVVLVLPAAQMRDVAWQLGCSRVVEGGPTRAASVRAGLSAVPLDAEIVVVHDAARPLASPQLFSLVIEAVRSGAAGAVPGLALADTVKRVSGGRVLATLDRSELVAVQTPQAFNAKALRRAHASNAEASDDAALLEALGETVVVVPGEARNLKLTEPVDLERLEAWAAPLAQPGTRAAAVEA